MSNLRQKRDVRPLTEIEIVTVYRLRRQFPNLTQRELAARVRRAHGTVGRILRGEVPTPDFIELPPAARAGVRGDHRRCGTCGARVTTPSCIACEHKRSDQRRST